MGVENFEPLGDRVLVEIEAAPETTKSGLYLVSRSPDMAPKRGLVLAVGSECTSVAKGDTVLLRPRTGVEIEVKDSEKEYLVIDTELVLGKYRSKS